MAGDDPMASTRGSIRRLKMDGDNGHPLWVPLGIGNIWGSILEVYTLAEGNEYKARMAENMGSVKPNFSRAFCIYFQWIRSNAFFASRDKDKEGTQPSMLDNINDPSCGIRRMVS